MSNKAEYLKTINDFIKAHPFDEILTVQMDLAERLENLLITGVHSGYFSIGNELKEEDHPLVTVCLKELQIHKLEDVEERYLHALVNGLLSMPVDKCKEYSLAAQALLYILGGVPLALFGKKLGYRKILDDEMEKLFKVLPYVSYGFEEKQLLFLESLKDSVTLENKIREKGLFHVLKLISETKGLLEEIAKDTENLLKALESIKENRMKNINKDEDIDSYIH